MGNDYTKPSGKQVLKSILLLWLIMLIQLGYAQEYRGRVVGISDGDTFTLLTGEKKQIKARLSEIDRGGGPHP